ncbi:MAG: hypothetical protein RAK23_03620 [Thermoplasmata archaeon]|nr:hypothetical protein [Thermoplasmata archaeon]
MRHIIGTLAVIGISILLLSLVNSNISAGSSISNVTFPSIEIHFLNGTNTTITDQMWKDMVFPTFLSKSITTYNWSNNSNLKYVFFDYSLTGLNPYGAQFILALEQYGSVSNATIEKALIYINGEQSLYHPGYTNGQLLNMGVLPGFSNATIPSQNSTPFYMSIPFIVLMILIASVFIMYFVFNKYT